MWCDLQIEKILSQHKTATLPSSSLPVVCEPEIELVPYPPHDVNRVVLLREVKSTVQKFLRCRNKLERETLSLVLQGLNDLAGFGEQLNPLVLAETPLKNTVLPALDHNSTPYNAEILKQFWHNYKTILRTKNINHAKDKELIAINLPYFVAVCKREGLELPDRTRLFDALRDSESPYPQYIRDNYTVRSTITNTRLACWLFKAPVDWSVL